MKLARPKNLFCSILLLALLASPASLLGQVAATKVAIANPAKVFNELQETKDLKQAMENKRKTLEAQSFEKEQRIKDLRNLRDQLKPDAPQYAERNRELLQATIEYQVWGQSQQADMQAEQKRQMLSLFQKITNAVQKVATAKGVELVIAEQRPEFDQVNLDQLNVDQLRGLINSRNVLFSNPAADISNDVIAEMDKEYKAGR